MNLRGMLFPFGLSTGAFAVAALVLTSAGLARPTLDDDDDEKAEARQIAHQGFVENCLMCHGEEMTSRQRLTAKQWTAEVEKMMGWGSPLPPERKDGLIAYLTESYPNGKATPPAARMAPADALASDRQDAPGVAVAIDGADPQRGAALFVQHCVACHGPNARGGEIGVNLVTKPILVRDDEFHTLLHQGLRRMPSFAPVLDPKAETDLLAYLRQTR